MKMHINQIQPTSAPLHANRNLETLPKQEQKSFKHVLKDVINNVNDMQIKSDRQTEALAHGKTDQLHDVMITAQKASITLETTVQIQRKVIDAYNEIMRMQV